MAEKLPDHEREAARLNRLIAMRQKKMLEIWPKLLIAVMVVVVVLGVYTYMKHVQEMAEQKTWKEIAEAEIQPERATLPDRLEKIVKKNPGTNATFFAEIEILRGRFDAGEIPAAKAAAEEFLKEHPNNFFAPQIRLEYARLLEYEDNWAAARKEYQTVIKAGKAYLQPEAYLGNARCLELEGRKEDAKIAYFKIKDLATDNYWPRQTLQTANLRLLALENPVPTLQAAPVDINPGEALKTKIPSAGDKVAPAVPEEEAAGGKEAGRKATETKP